MVHLPTLQPSSYIPERRSYKLLQIPKLIIGLPMPMVDRAKTFPLHWSQILMLVLILRSVRYIRRWRCVAWWPSLNIGWKLLVSISYDKGNTWMFDLLEKKNSNSLAADADESLPCAAFFTPPSPKSALIEFGAYCLAFCTSVGPIRSLHFLTQLSEINSIPTTKSEVMNSTKPL